MVLPILLAVVVGLVVTQIAMFATTVYLHRGITHRALAVHPVFAFGCRSLLWITTGMRPREWAAVHRRHHAATDTPEDPHSPAQVGFWRVQLTNAAMYRRVARDGVTVDKYSRDLPPDRFDRWMFDHAWFGLGVGVTLLCVLFTIPFGPWGIALGFLAAVVHMVSYLGLSGAVNAVGHTFGRRPHPNSATNGWLLALFTWGEGLHNNHHDMPTSARFSRRAWPFDHAWWTIRVLTWVHLVRLRTVRYGAPAARGPAASS
ncbi:MAG: fatty acid desaturase [Acidimicrobiia bacterium]